MRLINVLAFWSTLRQGRIRIDLYLRKSNLAVVIILKYQCLLEMALALEVGVGMAVRVREGEEEEESHEEQE